MKSSFAPRGFDPAKVDALLRQAESLADALSIAFYTPSGVPDPVMFLSPSRRRSRQTKISAYEISTMVLEWRRLSDLTGNPKYGNLAQKAERHLLRPTGSSAAWPGLLGDSVSTLTGEFLDSDGGWSVDNCYEYPIKMYQYKPTEFSEYRDRWVLAANSTMAHLTSHPTTRGHSTYLSQFSAQRTQTVSTHCE